MFEMAKSKSLRHLGKPSAIPASPAEAVLDRVQNPHSDTDYVARFTAPEFTTLCPITGQPDFAHLVIDYVPGKWLVESKSLKLYAQQLSPITAPSTELHRRDRQTARRPLSRVWLPIGGSGTARARMPIDVFWAGGQTADRRSGCPTRASRPIGDAVSAHRARPLPTALSSPGPDRPKRMMLPSRQSRPTSRPPELRHPSHWTLRWPPRNAAPARGEIRPAPAPDLGAVARLARGFIGGPASR